MTSPLNLFKSFYVGKWGQVSGKSVNRLNRGQVQKSKIIACDGRRTHLVRRRERIKQWFAGGTNTEPSILSVVSATEFLKEVKALPDRERQKLFLAILSLEEAAAP